MHISEIPDDVLMARIEPMMTSVVRIAALTPEQRCKPCAKGTSPEQFGFIQASLLVVFWGEAARRGLMDPM